MSVSYVVQKCTSCAGTKFDYDKETKTWKCLYCGAVIERHEQADSMFTIKNVVRQVLQDIAYQRMSSAQNNLTECEKIDARYVGTILSEMAYELNMIVIGNISKAEQQNYFAMMKKHYMDLCAMGDAPTEEEMALYDSIDSPEAAGVLILMFDSMNLTVRRDTVLRFFDPSRVYSMDLNSNMMSFAVRNGYYDLFEQILHNTDNINKKTAMKTLLTECPDSGNKPDNVRLLIEKGEEFTEEDQKEYENYLSTSGDSALTKCRIAAVLCQTPARPSVDCLMSHVIARTEDPQAVSELMTVLIGNALLDVEIASIINFSLIECGYEICLQNLEMLRKSDNYVELSSQSFRVVLSRRDLDVESKLSLIDAMMEFEVPEKVRHRFISEYLCDSYDDPETRTAILKHLFSLGSDLPTNAVEKYIVSCGTDRERKPEIVRMIFEMDLNRSFFHRTLSNYITGSADGFAVKREVIYQLLLAGLKVDPGACVSMLLMQGIPSQQRTELLRMAGNSGVSYNDVMDIYFSALRPGQFDSAVFGELIQKVTKVSNRTLMRYVLECRDLSAAKTASVSRLVQHCSYSPAMMNCSITFGRDRINCNLIQAYLLLSPDDGQTACGVMEALGGNKGSASADIDVSGMRMKFRKYVSQKSKCGELSETSQALCAFCRL